MDGVDLLAAINPLFRKEPHVPKGHKEYRIEVEGDFMRIGFGSRAQNDQLCREARDRLKLLVATGILNGGPLLKISGATSVPVAMTIASVVCRLYQAVAVYDNNIPGIAKFVVVTSQEGSSHQEGDLIQ